MILLIKEKRAIQTNLLIYLQFWIFHSLHSSFLLLHIVLLSKAPNPNLSNSLSMNVST